MRGIRFLFTVLNRASGPKVSWTFGRHDTLIYGERFSSYLRRLSSEADSGVFDPFLRSNLFVRELLSACLRCIVRPIVGWTLTDYYFAEVLRTSQASRVVTCILANKSIFRVRSALSKSSSTRFFFFQTGMIWLQEVPENLGLRKGDVLFTYSSAYASAWSGADARNNGEVLALGSLPSLFEKSFERISMSTSRNKVAFISSWRGPIARNGSLVKLNRVTLEAVPYEVWFSPERLLLPKLKECLREDGMSLDVLGSTHENSANSTLEKDFYASFLGEEIGWEFSSRSSTLSNYKKLADYDLIVAVDSALAYEALALGFKTMFLHFPDTHEVRFPPGYPDTDSRFLPLILDPNFPETWREQIRSVRRASRHEFESIVKAAIGQSVLDARLETAIKRMA